jgi:hypothetical protein
MKATLILRRSKSFEDGAALHIVVWLVPALVPPSGHSFKYRLVYVREGVRVIGFDNERGKGDHRHLHGDETAYTFTDIATLLEDFTVLVTEERKD